MPQWFEEEPLLQAGIGGIAIDCRYIGTDSPGLAMTSPLPEGIVGTGKQHYLAADQQVVANAEAYVAALS